VLCVKRTAQKTARYAGGEKSLSIKTSFDRIESVPAETKAKEVFILKELWRSGFLY